MFYFSAAKLITFLHTTKIFNENLSKIKKDNPFPKKPDVPNDDNPDNQKSWETYNAKYDAVKEEREEEKKAENDRHKAELERLQNLKLDKNVGIESIDNSISEKKAQISSLENLIQEDETKAKNEFEQNKNGLGMKLRALHALAMEDYIPWFYKDKPIIKDDRPIDTNTDSLAVQVSNSMEEDYLYGAENHKFASLMDSMLHAWWWYLFNSAQGLIMLLFILIDISPVLYKMMLADGNYDNYLHQEKLLAQDKIRLSLSNMLRKLDESELKRVAPFIMGDIYEKMAGDSYVFKTEEEFRTELANLENKSKIWKFWPFRIARWIFWKEETRPTAPVIIMEPKSNTYQQEQINQVNEAVFDEVLDMKRRIILASYRRWYKRQHDNILGDRVDDDNAGRPPFDDVNSGEE